MAAENQQWVLKITSWVSRDIESRINMPPFSDWHVIEVEVEVTLQLTVGQSVSMSRYRAHSGTCDQILLSVRRLFSESCCHVFVGRPLWREVGSVICLSQSSNVPLFISSIYFTYVLQFSNYIWSFIWSRLSTADYAKLPQWQLLPLTQPRNGPRRKYSFFQLFCCSVI
jgi:hypothetical protein